MIEEYRKILKDYWGYDNFRGIQEDIIQSIGSGRDTLGLMPTGGGKSITFQVPAMAKDGLCIVITPLIALMKDQVRNLRDRGIKAIAIYSGMTREEIIIALENCIFGNYKFLYISPERLDSEIFRIKLCPHLLSNVLLRTLQKPLSDLVKYFLIIGFTIPCILHFFLFSAAFKQSVLLILF